MKSIKELKKAKKQLKSVGVQTSITNNNLYVHIEGLMLELSDFEVDFRARLLKKNP